MPNYEEIARANETIRKTPIQGKDYAEVNQRIKAFRMVYPEGYIMTELVSNENGVCVMRASVGRYEENGGCLTLGTGTAYEKEGSTYINKTSYIENCVPLDTEILTENGWKYYFQVKPGDMVLSINMETGKVEYTPLERVNVYNNHPIIDLETSRFHVRCTPQHRWLCRSQYEPLHKTATSELKSSEKIVQNVKQEVDPSEVGRMLGWLMCDCEITMTANGMPSTAYIRQTKYVDDVTELFGEGHKTIKYDEAWGDSYEWIIPAEKVRLILGAFGMASYKDLANAMLKAPIQDVAGCCRSMMLADGEDRGFSSTYPELIEAVQIMCARLGIATGHITSRMMRNSTKPIYTLSIKRTDGAYCSEMKISNLPPCDVWCPTTENGTWFMRQGDFVTATSNCETSAVGRALGMAGFGIDTSVASAEEVQNAMLNQGEDKPQETAKASPKQIEILAARYTGDNLAKLLATNNISRLEDMPRGKASELIGKLTRR